MTLQEFVNKYNGQSNVGNTPENKGQCVGLVMVWLKDNLGNPHVWGHAKDLLANADRNAYEVIMNTPDGVPVAGDVVCWNGRMGGGYGHTAIVLKADVNSIEVFEQNTSPTSCHIHTYPNYNNVQGWMRAKNYTNKVMVQVESDTFKELVDKATKYDSFKAAGFTTVDDVLKRLGELQHEKDDVQNQLNSEIEKNQDLREANAKLTEADEDLGEQLLDAQHKLAEKEKPVEKAQEEVINHYEPILDEFFNNLIKGKKAKSLIDKIWGWLR